jgi:hypothetical protein
MNRRTYLVIAITLVSTILLATGCTASQAATETQACPTAAPLACPTTAAQVEPNLDSWVSHYKSFTNIRITFDPGNKCSMDVLKPATGGLIVYEIVVNDQTYEHYVVSAITLDEGYTLEDAAEYDRTHIGVVPPPPFSEIQTIEVVAPRTWTSHFVMMPKSPLYFACIIQGPAEQQVIDQFGPVEIAQ